MRETPIGFREFSVEVHSLESPVQNSNKKPNHDPLPDYVNTEERREIEEFMQEELNLFEPKEEQEASYMTLLEQVSIDSRKQISPAPVKLKGSDTMSKISRNGGIAGQAKQVKKAHKTNDRLAST